MNRDRASSLRSEESMDTDPQLGSLTSINRCRNELQLTSQCSGLDIVDANWMRNLLDAAIFIISNGTSRPSDIPKEWQRSTATVVECFDLVAASASNNIEFLYRLIQTYANLYGIQLHLIVYLQKRYMIIDENYFVNQNVIQIHRDNHAVICCNADNTCYLPLHIEDSNQRKRTIFTANELIISSQIQHIIDEANRNITADHSNQVDRNAGLPLDPIGHMAVDENSSRSDHQDTLMTGRAAVEKLLQNTSLLAAALESGLQSIRVPCEDLNLDLSNLHQNSVEELRGALNNQLLIISQIVQVTREPAASHEIATNQAANASISEPGPSSNSLNENHAQTTTARIPVISSSTSVPAIIGEAITDLIHYVVPALLNEPKQNWHVRYFSDLVPKKREKSATSRTASVPSAETQEKATIGLLQGIGGERSPIQVRVPSAQQYEMYLGCGTRTIRGENHSSKILVPAKTTVIKDLCSHENNLDCLNFTECNPLDQFDPATNTVYMKITPEEHGAQCKDVPLYMLNLYQNPRLTKKMIQDGNLRQCVLAFWLCIKVGEVYRAISRESYSSIITES